jgi:hypothetical protein
MAAAPGSEDRQRAGLIATDLCSNGRLSLIGRAAAPRLVPVIDDVNDGYSFTFVELFCIQGFQSPGSSRRSDGRTGNAKSPTTSSAQRPG